MKNSRFCVVYIYNQTIICLVSEPNDTLQIVLHQTHATVSLMDFPFPAFKLGHCFVKMHLFINCQKNVAFGCHKNTNTNNEC